MCEQNFPKYRQHLNLLMKRLSKELAGPVSGFAQLRRESLAEGALSRKHKELIALGSAMAARCDACIAYHTGKAKQAGATDEEIAEAVFVAIELCAGAAVGHFPASARAMHQH